MRPPRGAVSSVSLIRGKDDPHVPFERARCLATDRSQVADNNNISSVECMIQPRRKDMAEDKQEWLASPSSDCCLSNHMHQGSPRGIFQNVAGLETYISRPSEKKGNGHIVLYFPDVWGMFKNGLLIMDSFADAGYLVIGPDYFRGDPVWKHRKDRHDKTTDPDFDYEAWKAKHTSFADMKVPEWIRCVKETFGGQSTKYACVGYVGRIHLFLETSDGQ